MYTMNNITTAPVNAELELLKKVLTGFVFPESSDRDVERPTGLSPGSLVKRIILALAARRGIRLVKKIKFDAEARIEGRDTPGLAYTMVGLKRLNNIQLAIETVLKEKIEGDVCECGVWRGGCSILARAVLKSHNSDRITWVADSFEGLPKPNAVMYPADAHSRNLSQDNYLSVPLASVKGNFERFGLLDDGVRFLKGWFKDTLPSAPIKKLAVLRADADMYESTMDILKNLYNKVSVGGFVIIDDYLDWTGCRIAVDEFRKSRNITAPLQTIDWTGVYWRV
jgi:O-methyltransferase